MATVSAARPRSSRLPLWGALCALAFAFPMAALCALLYRFPIPFGGYESGLAAAPRALLATVFYGVLGGFPVLALGGYLAGVAAGARSTDARTRVRLMLLFSGLVAFACVMVLAILDKLIGPW